MYTTSRRKFRGPTSDKMDRWKSRGEEKRREEKKREEKRRGEERIREKIREEKESEERRSEARKGQKKEDAGARKCREVAHHFIFPMICGSGGSKSRLEKAAGAKPSGQLIDEKLHAAASHVQVNIHKTHQVRSTFGS